MDACETEEKQDLRDVAGEFQHRTDYLAALEKVTRQVEANGVPGISLHFDPLVYGFNTAVQGVPFRNDGDAARVVCSALKDEIADVRAQLARLSVEIRAATSLAKQ